MVLKFLKIAKKLRNQIALIFIFIKILKKKSKSESDKNSAKNKNGDFNSRYINIMFKSDGFVYQLLVNKKQTNKKNIHNLKKKKLNKSLIKYYSKYNSHLYGTK